MRQGDFYFFAARDKCVIALRKVTIVARVTSNVMQGGEVLPESALGCHQSSTKCEVFHVP
jgi:hypothetical protein